MTFWGSAGVFLGRRSMRAAAVVQEITGEGKKRKKGRKEEKKGSVEGRGGPEPLAPAPARQRWGNMSAAHVMSQSVSVSCARKHARERARLGMTSRMEALLGPAACSPNLQTTLGTLSTCDESLPA